MAGFNDAGEIAEQVIWQAAELSISTGGRGASVP